ncbi:Phospholipase A2, major isoenzyme [Branchiostoma belcheri]|nr:Phospholipase A2, major isoenzyme [Branchiostoma belcheri]
MFVLKSIAAMMAVTLSLIAICTSNAEGHKHNSSKRAKNAFYLGRLIYCATQRNPLDYSDYGCWCGLGGSGEPMDDVDRCCKEHDECYDSVIDQCGYLFPYTATYNYNCRRGQITCAPNTSGWWWNKPSKKTSMCKLAVCNCDKTLAECYARHPYNNDNYNNCDS